MRKKVFWVPLVLSFVAILYFFQAPDNSMTRCVKHLTGKQIRGINITSENEDKALNFLAKKLKQLGYETCIFNKEIGWVAKRLDEGKKMIIVVHSRRFPKRDPAFAVPLKAEDIFDGFIITCFAPFCLYEGHGSPPAFYEGKLSYSYNSGDKIKGVILEK